jgi:hypothetical protein
VAGGGVGKAVKRGMRVEMGGTIGRAIQKEAIAGALAEEANGFIRANA